MLTNDVKKSHKVLGIIGGMGPLATIDLFNKITILTKAFSDQEHIHILIDSNTMIPDRTQAIFCGGTDPVPEIVSSARRLATAGADILLMPCNTAHYFLDKISQSVSIPILNMLRVTAQEVMRQNLHSVGLLATDGTIKSKIYQSIFEEQGVQVLLPSKKGQENMMNLIYKYIKACNQTYNLSWLLREIDMMMGNGVQSFILGCTELPIVFKDIHGIPYIDPTNVLARTAITAAGYDQVSH